MKEDVKEELERRNAVAERWRLLVESAPAVILQTTTDGMILFANEMAREHIGEEAVGRSFNELFDSGNAEATRGVIEEVLRTGQSLTYESRTSRDGEPLWFEHDVAPLGSDEPVSSLVFVSKDITERKLADEERRRLETQIQHAQKLESLGVLAGGIAHDFNNLLMGILGNASLALMDLAPESPARESIRDVEAAAKRAAELVRQMLAYSGQGRFVLEVLSLQHLVEEMAHLAEVSICKKAVLMFNFADNVPTVRADATQVRQIVMNLLHNASDAIGDKSGVISISTGAMYCDRDYLSETYLDDDLPEGLYSYIEVSDTGVGMDEEMKRKIFDPFFTTKFAGRGLGLAAVLGIVRGHRGAIKVYTEPGRGTTFKVLFPAMDQSINGDATSDERVLRGTGTVLLVDDDETVLAVVGRMVEKLGFTVLKAADGLEAIEIFRDRSDEIACVLLDLTMPNMCGDDAFREMRRIRREVRVILSSGYNEQEVIQRFAGKGLAGFIQKPYRFAELRERLQALGLMVEKETGSEDEE